MRQTHTGLIVCHLTTEQHLRTCGYWFTVTVRHGTPHTAFATRAGLDRWLRERGLTLAGLLDEQPSWCEIVGTYRTFAHFSDAEVAEFYDLQGEQTRTLSNGEYVEALITTDEDGIRTVHTLNPNVRDRKVYDYRESQALMK